MAQVVEAARQGAEVIGSDLQTLQPPQVPKLDEVTWWNLVVAQPKRVQLGEAARSELEV